MSGYSYMYCLVSEVQHNIMEKTNFFHDCEIKSGSGPGNEAAMSYSPEGERADVETIDNPCLQKTFLSSTIKRVHNKRP